MVGVLESGSSGLDSSPGWGLTAACSLLRHFTLIVPLHLGVY